jgi:hypothetical protein
VCSYGVRGAGVLHHVRRDFRYEQHGDLENAHRFDLADPPFDGTTRDPDRFGRWLENNHERLGPRHTASVPSRNVPSERIGTQG